MKRWFSRVTAPAFWRVFFVCVCSLRASPTVPGDGGSFAQSRDRTKYTDEGPKLHFSEALCKRELDLETTDVLPHRETLGVVPSITAPPPPDGAYNGVAGSSFEFTDGQVELEWNNKTGSGQEPSAVISSLFPPKTYPSRKEQ